MPLAHFCDVVLLVTSRFVDDALEDPPNGLRSQRCLTCCHQALEHFAFAVRVVDLDPMSPFDLAYSQHVFEALLEELENLMVDAIDRRSVPG